MFDKGLSALKKLERAALLSIERVLEEMEYVRLHDLVRDVILQIVGSRFMIKAGVGLEGTPDEESWRDELAVVSLMNNDITEISNLSPKCNMLSTLLLQENFFLSVVCDGFFRYLHGLKHLDLSHSLIMTLPKSISLLKNLTALILRNCRSLENVPSLANLTSLERLDLCQTSISQLPQGTRSLIKLRYLNLFLTGIETIGVGVISKLTALQYLAVDAIFDVMELNSLNNLEHLIVFFKEFVRFSIFIEQMKIKGRPNSYSIIFTNFRQNSRVRMSKYLSENHIYLRKLDRTLEVPKDLIVSGDLCLNKEFNLRESKDPDGNQCNQLEKILFVNHYSSIEGLFSKKERSPEVERRVKLCCENQLQEFLQDIHSLEISCDGNLTSLGDFVFDTVRNQIDRGPKPFSNLKCIELLGCLSLKKLFPLGLVSSLHNIEEISVYLCDDLEELMEGAPDKTMVGGVVHPKNYSLPKLKRICLVDLPNLQSLCRKDEVIWTPSLRWITITRCPMLKRMPFLKEEKECLESLEWDPLGFKSMVALQGS